MRRVALLSTWILVTVGSGLLGRWVAEAHTTPPRTGPMAAHPPSRAPQKGRPAEHTSAMGFPMDLAACKAQLAACVSGAGAGEHTRGPAFPWTDTVPENQRPKAVTAALRDVREDCPLFAGRPAWMDCDEYPCLVWLEADGLDAPELRGCQSWPYSAQVGLFVTATPGGHVTGLQVYPALPAGALRGDLAERVRLRTRIDRPVARDAMRRAAP